MASFWAFTHQLFVDMAAADIFDRIAPRRTRSSVSATIRQMPADTRSNLLIDALLPKDVPEGHIVRSWLDSWAGVGRVVDAMHAAGYNVCPNRYNNLPA